MDSALQLPQIHLSGHSSRADKPNVTAGELPRVAPQLLANDIDIDLFAGLGAGIANREEGLGDAGGVVQGEPVFGGQLLDG